MGLSGLKFDKNTNCIVIKRDELIELIDKATDRFSKGREGLATEKKGLVLDVTREDPLEDSWMVR